MRLPVTIHTKYSLHEMFLASYKEWLDKQSVTANTARVYYSRIKHFFLFMDYSGLGDKPFDSADLLNEAMLIYLDFLKESKGEIRSINANINALGNLAEFLGMKNIKLKRERCVEKTTKILSADEQMQFLKSVDAQELVRDKALALLLFYSGLRLSDCANLKIENIVTTDTQAMCIKLHNGNTMRLHSAVAPLLQHWLAEREKIISAIECGESLDVDHSVNASSLWLTEKGEKLSVSGITFVIRRIGQQAGLGSLCAETLRRTCLNKSNNSAAA